MKTSQIAFFHLGRAGLLVFLALFTVQFAFGAATGVSSITLTASDEHFYPSQRGTITFGVKIQTSAAVQNLSMRFAATVTTSQWEFVSCSGEDMPTALPRDGDFAPWEFGFVTTPASPVSFNITLRYTGDVLTTVNSAYEFVATPLVGTEAAVDSKNVPITARIIVNHAVFHTADTNKDLRISLSEILGVIQIYNTRNASIRTGAYTCGGGVFSPDPTVASPEVPVAAAITHSADISGPSSATISNGAIESAELTKFLTFASYTVNGVRTGQYHVGPAATGFDKFAPGPK